jgi:MFS family permease
MNGTRLNSQYFESHNTRLGRGDGAHRMSSGCGMDYLFPFEFLPGMAATFADYLGMAMLTPALPYWCAEAGMSPTDVATWTGAITTAQYAGAALGNFAVGAMGDGLGARETLAATLLGDVVLFTLTALATKPGALLAIRLVAGMSSPLVAALMYILQRATTKSQTLKGVNAYSLSVNGGYALGGVVVGVGYASMGWLGLNLLSAGVAGVALVFVLVTAKGKPPVAVTDSGVKRREEAEAGVGVGAGMSPRASVGGGREIGDASEASVSSSGGGSTEREGVKSSSQISASVTAPLPPSISVFRTGAMVSHCYTAFNTGYLFMGFIVLFVLMAKQVLGWSVAEVGWAFMAIPVANVCAMYGLIPPFIRRFGVHCSVTCGSIMTVCVLGVLSLPAVYSSAEGILGVTFMLIFCVVLLQVPNQMRIKLIADRYAPGSMGRITGASRVCFATGQTCSPIIVALLYVQEPHWAVLSMLFVAASVPFVFVICGQTLWADPPAIGDEVVTGEREAINRS